MNEVIEVIDKQLYSIFSNFISLNWKIICEKKIVIFGAGVRGLMLLTLLLDRGTYDVVFVDNDIKKQGRTVMGVPIYDRSYLETERYKKMVLLPMENEYKARIQMENMGYQRDENYYILSGRQYNESLKEFNKDAKKLLLGDCIVDNILIHETNKRSLRDILKEKLSAEISIVAEHGLYMKQYYYMILNYINEHTELEQVIILVSPEIFHSKYQLYPNAQHADFMEKILKIEDSEQKEFLDEVKNRVAIKGIQSFSPDRTESKENLKQRIYLQTKLNYLFRVDKQNENFQYLKKCIDICEKNDIRINIIVEPLNYDFALECCGKDFEVGYNKILDELKSFISNTEYTKFCDFSKLLNRENFIAISSINEAIDIKGRIILADSIEKQMEDKEKCGH